MPRSTLRRELIVAFALVFAGALAVGVLGVMLLLPLLTSTAEAIVYLTLLVTGDLVVFFLFGRWLVRTRVLFPLDRMVAEAEAIAEGDYGRRLPGSGYEEVDRLSDALNQMAGRLIEHQWELRRNIQSLEETNRQLTQARDDLIRAEKMASLGQMAAGVAHEIGNPLAAIMGNVDLLKRRVDGGATDLVEATSEQVRRIDRIIRGLLDYSRLRQTRARPIDANDVIGKVADLVSGQGRLKGVDIDLDLADIPAVSADPYQLEQVLVNLLLNAADAMADAAVRRITVQTGSSVYRAPAYFPVRRKDDPPGVDYSHRRRFSAPEHIARANPFTVGARIVTIRVADTGTGIQDELVERIFEPFMTTKEPGKGTGLGLAVCARLVDGMDGTIRAGNTDAGAEFTIQLPASDQTAEEVAP